MLVSGAMKDVHDMRPAHGVLEVYVMRQNIHMKDNLKVSVSKCK